MLLDTCESGALVAGYLRPRSEAAASEAGIGRLHEATGRPLLTAAAGGQFAYEGVKGDDGERHGVFTSALLDALRHAGTRDGDKITLSALVAHVQSHVPKLAAQFGGQGATRAAANFRRSDKGEQSARFGSRGEDFVLVSALR